MCLPSHAILKWILILGNMVSVSFAASTQSPSSSKLFGQIYLVKYGYIAIPDKANQTGFGRSSLLDPKEVSDGIKLFQQKNGLKVTGILDEETRKKIELPRCGVKDIQTRSMFGKWKQKNLKYKFVGPVTQYLPMTVVREAIQSAFNYWADVTPLTFTEVFDEEKSNFILKFSRYSHDDEFPFDGRDGTLAHAFFPTDGRIHFDSDEIFTEGEDRGYNLRIVAAHEIGHALGLPHSYDSEALMASFYAGYTAKNMPLLNEDDKQKIQQIYGQKPISTITPRSKGTTKSRRMTRLTSESTTARLSTTPEPTTTTPEPTTTTPEPMTTTPEPTNTTPEPTTTTPEPTTTTPEPTTTTPEPTTTTPEPTTTEEITTTEEQTTTEEIIATVQPSLNTNAQWDKIVPRPSEPDVCATSTRISGAFMGKDGDIYLVIRNQHSQWIYRNPISSSLVKKEWPYQYDAFFKRLELKTMPNIDAAFYSSLVKKHFIFSGTKVFSFDEFGYFIRQDETGKDVSYAFNTEKSPIVVTKDNSAWQFDPRTNDFKSSQPISSIFPGIAPDIEAAAEDDPWPQEIEHIYFFKGREFFKYHGKKQQLIKTGNLGDSFFGCRQYPVPKFK